MARLVIVQNARRFNTYLPADLIDALKAQAIGERKSASAVIAEALREHISGKTLRAFRAEKKPTKKKTARAAAKKAA